MVYCRIFLANFEAAFWQGSGRTAGLPHCWLWKQSSLLPCMSHTHLPEGVEQVNTHYLNYIWREMIWNTKHTLLRWQWHRGESVQAGVGARQSFKSFQPNFDVSFKEFTGLRMMSSFLTTPWGTCSCWCPACPAPTACLSSLQAQWHTSVSQTAAGMDLWRIFCKKLGH